MHLYKLAAGHYTTGSLDFSGMHWDVRRYGNVWAAQRFPDRDAKMPNLGLGANKTKRAAVARMLKEMK